jgi:hypothetical protein
MPTLGTQNIATSYSQLLKADTLNPISATLQAITSGDSSGTSALALSTTEVQSTGSFTVASASRLLGSVTFGTSFTASTGTATIGTLSVSTATISTATISTATIPLQLGNVTFGSNITASTGTATIGTLSASTATISTATIPLQLGAITFGSNITASTGTATIGTEIVSTSTIGTLNVSGTATVGSLEIGGTAGPLITRVSYGTAAFTAATVSAFNGAGTTNGTFTVTGSQLGDMVIGSLDSLGTATGSAGLIIGFHPIATNVVRYSITNPTTTAGTVPAGTLFATAIRMVA